MGVITVTFFDKMSCRRARVKIKRGMVTFLQPCVCFISSRLRYRMTDTKVCMEFHLVPIRIPKEILTVFCAAILMGLTSYISMLLRAKSTSKTENAGNMAYSALFNCHTGTPLFLGIKFQVLWPYLMVVRLPKLRWYYIRFLKLFLYFRYFV